MTLNVELDSVVSVNIHWYVIHTKPREEQRALENLVRQGYECYLPLLPVEKIRRRQVLCVEEPLFPRYLFIRLETSPQGQSWSAIRYTKGVSRLVSFGDQPARLDDDWIKRLRELDDQRHQTPVELFSPGEKVHITEGPFVGIEGVFDIRDGEQRVMVLIEMLSKPVRVPLHPTQLRRVQ